MTILDFFSKYSPVRNNQGQVVKNYTYANSVAKQTGISINTKIGTLVGEVVETPPQIERATHLFAHMDRNFVRLGDKVIKGVTPIGTIGTGNGQYFSHLHFSISVGLTPNELLGYISEWSKTKVQKYYTDPRGIDFEKMFGTKMDVGNFGYDWLQWVGYGYHPGVDVNGLKGGNTDFGMPFKASCDGEVIYEWRGWTKNRGWGNVVMVLDTTH